MSRPWKPLVLSVLVLLVSLLPARVRPVAAAPVLCGTPTTVTLWAGQTINTGSVIVGNDATTLYVTVTTIGDWLLRRTHLQIATSLDGIPTNEGGAAPGQFTYQTTHAPYVSTYTYSIPLASLSGSSWYIALHAEVVRVVGGTVVQEETAWGGDLPLPGANWGRYLTYTRQPCTSAPPEETGGEGCTPGYWKNHLSSWTATGYAPTQTVQQVFSAASSPLGSATLRQALSFRGGRTLDGARQILLRAGVAALLNTAHPTVDYGITQAEVISAVNQALASTDRATILATATRLDRLNNAGCPLSR